MCLGLPPASACLTCPLNPDLTSPPVTLGIWPACPISLSPASPPGAQTWCWMRPPVQKKVGLSLWLFLFFPRPYMNGQRKKAGIHRRGTRYLAAETHVNTIKLWDPSTSSTSGSQGPRILLVGMCLSAKAHPQFWHSTFAIFHKSL